VRFLHLAPASRERAIKRAGLSGSKVTLTTTHGTTSLSRAIFAMPIIADFWTTHQWLRELRRGHDERLIAVCFRVDDDETVHVGRYNEPHQPMRARASARWIAQHPAGAEVVVAHRIESRDILRIRQITQLVGWTSVPEGEKKWNCVCHACLPRGSRDLMRRVRAAFADATLAAAQARSEEQILEALGRLEIPLERARGRIAPSKLLVHARSPNPKVRRSAAQILGHFKRAQVEKVLLRLLEDDHPEVQCEAVEALTRVAGVARTAALLDDSYEGAVVTFVELLEFEPDSAKAVKVLETVSRNATGPLQRAVETVARSLLADPQVGAPEQRHLRALAGPPSR